MSRMQNILDKAQREGTVHRLRVPVFAEPAPPAPVAPPTPVPAAAPAPPIAANPPLPRTAPTFDPIIPIVAPEPRINQQNYLDPRLVTVCAPESIAAEQYRALRTRVTHGEGVGANNVLLITSPGRADGKSLTAANLALAMAEDGRRVCLVDANLRNPMQHRLFGIGDGPGLSDVLSGRAVIDDVIVQLEDQRISMIAAGSALSHPAELLGTTAMRRTMETLRSRFDAVIVDSPGASLVADVGVITPFVDGIIVVVRAGATAKPAILDTVAALDGRVLGVVLNDTV
jgi:protein-tyrosine kinase